MTDDTHQNAGTSYERKRWDIITGAARVFNRRGFAAGTTKEIAAEVGLSQSAIYHYVGAKTLLLEEIALQVDHDMMAALEAGLAWSEDAREQLEAILERFTQAIVENRDTYSVYWKELKHLSPEVRNKIDQDERAFMNRLAKVVKQLQDDGTLPGDAPSMVVTEGIVGMVCWTYRWFRPEGPLRANEVAKVFASMLGLDRGTR